MTATEVPTCSNVILVAIAYDSDVDIDTANLLAGVQAQYDGVQAVFTLANPSKSMMYGLTTHPHTVARLGNFGGADPR